MYQKNHKIEPGFTLVEIMISLLIVSIGFLGIAALQIKGQQYNHVGYLRTQGVFLAYDIMDRMRINTVAAESGGYAPDPLPTELTADCDLSTPGCAPSDLATYDLVKWQELVKTTLLNPEIGIIYSTIPVKKYNIRISWQYLGNQNLQESQQWIYRP